VDHHVRMTGTGTVYTFYFMVSRLARFDALNVNCP